MVKTKDVGKKCELAGALFESHIVALRILDYLSLLTYFLIISYYRKSQTI
jgi:hypothetical protein